MALRREQSWSEEPSETKPSERGARSMERGVSACQSAKNSENSDLGCGVMSRYSPAVAEGNPVLTDHTAREIVKAAFRDVWFDFFGPLSDQVGESSCDCKYRIKSVLTK